MAGRPAGTEARRRWLSRAVAALVAAAAAASVRPPAPPAAQRPGPVVVDTPWPEWRRQRVSSDPALLRAVSRLVGEPARSPPSPPGPLWPLWRLRWEPSPGRSRELWVLDDGRIWDPRLQSPRRGPEDAAAAVGQAVDGLARQLFGEPVPWPQAAELFPLDTQAVLEDVRTGVRLTVRRYGGYLHADVEPATRRDTAVLRALYGGRWSWRRRPVVALLGGRRVAASINGMPHGGELVGDNDFAGHFCLHFLQSRVHRSGRLDPSHQVMVWEAAGQLAQRMARADPEQLVAWGLAAIYEQDEAALSLATAGGDAGLARRLFEAVRYATVERVSLPPPGSGPPVARVEAVVYYTGPHPDVGFRQSLRLTLIPRRAGDGSGGWAIYLPDLAALLERPTSAPLPGPALTPPEC